MHLKDRSDDVWVNLLRANPELYRLDYVYTHRVPVFLEPPETIIYKVKTLMREIYWGELNPPSS